MHRLLNIIVMDYKQNLEHYLSLRIDALTMRLANVDLCIRFYLQDQIDELKFILCHLDDF